MGTEVTKAVEASDDIEIVAGVDIAENKNLPYPVFKSFGDINADAQVIVDFSSPSALDDILLFSKKNKIPAILCATGYNDNQIESIKNASKNTAIFRSSNMSLGINLISELAKTAAKILGETFDVEIVESHHNQKLDAPSGTALMLEKAVEEGLNYEPKLIYDRHERLQKRQKNEIGMHSIRGGAIVGEHEIIFAGDGEVVKISHQALSKKVFAQGAIKAAVFMKDKKTGLYDMSDVIAES